MKKYLLILSFFLLSPSAFAAFHWYNCAVDFTTLNGATCSGGKTVLGNVNTEQAESITDPHTQLNYVSGGTYFLVASSTGTTGTWAWRIGDQVAHNYNSAAQGVSCNNCEFTMNPTTLNATAREIGIIGGSTYGFTNGDATVQVCVSDTAYSDCLPAAVTNPFQLWLHWPF